MILLLAACAGRDAPPSDSGPVFQECEAIQDVDAEILGEGTVVRLTTSTDEEGSLETVRVSAWGLQSQDLPDPTASGVEHEVVLLGLPVAAEVQVDLALGDCVQTVEFETGAPQMPFPFLTDTLGTGAWGTGGWFVATTLTEDQQFSAVLGTDGAPVLYLDDGKLPLRTVLSLDRKAILVNNQAPIVDTNGHIRRQPLDGSRITSHAIPDHHTDFVERPDGTLAALVYDARRFGQREILTSAIVEVAPDGTQTTLWSAFDAVSLDLDEQYDPSTRGGDGWPNLEEWMHVNAISWDEARQVYLLTESNQERMFEVGADGSTHWVAGIGPGEMEVIPSDALARPHSIEMLEDGRVMVFNRGEFDNDEAQSCAFVSIFEIDAVENTATELERYESEDCRVVSFFGEARTVGNRRFVNYSSAGVMEVLDTDDEPVYQLQSSLGAAFGYGGYVESLYR